MVRRLWSLLARLVPFRQPVSLHNPTWRDRVDPEPYGRLDIADGLPRPARPVDDADDLARQLVAEHARGRHAGDTYQERLDRLIGECEDEWPETRPAGRHRAPEDPVAVIARENLAVLLREIDQTGSAS